MVSCSVLGADNVSSCAFLFFFCGLWVVGIRISIPKRTTTKTMPRIIKKVVKFIPLFPSGALEAQQFFQIFPGTNGLGIQGDSFPEMRRRLFLIAQIYITDSQI